MPDGTFRCSECANVVPGPLCAISMTIECSNCGETATAYRYNDDGITE